MPEPLSRKPENESFMNIRKSLQCAAALGIAGGFLNACPSALAASKKLPNIVFMFADDHAYQAISAYGSKINRTPNIDRIANEGMRFDRAMVNNSICGPSRAAILTGKYSHKNGFFRNGNLFDGSQQTFPKLLQKAGYQTAMIGKWHLSSDPTGFDYWQVLVGQGPYYNPPMLTPGADGRTIRTNHVGYTTEIISDLTMDWLKNKRDKDKPFMLMFQHKAPPREWAPGPRQINMYDDVTIWEPPTLFDDYSGRGTAAKQNDMTIAKTMTPRDLKLVPPGNLTPEQLKIWNDAYGPKNEAFKKANLQGADLVRWKYQRYIKDYLRCIAAVDDAVGEVLNYLDKSGLAKDTLVIYTADQGFYLGEHGWFDKRWIYEESLRTPLVARWPGVIKPGSVNKDLVANLDFAETFLDIVGQPIPKDMQGYSMLPLLKGTTPKDWRKSFYYHYYGFPGAHSVAKHYGVVTERYKLAYFYQLKEWELYDTKEDPMEMQNVFDNPKYAEIQSELRAELTRLQKRLDEPDPEKAVPGDPGMRGKGKKRRPKGKTRVEKILQCDDLSAKVTTKPDPSVKAITVGARLGGAAEGVILAQGGASQGYSLYIRGNKPVFAVRSNDQLFEVVGESLPAGKPVHVAGVLTSRGQLQLLVNGKKVAQAKGDFIQNVPADGLSIGNDAGSLVANYEDNFKFKGTATDIRLYWGELERAELQGWAK